MADPINIIALLVFGIIFILAGSKLVEKRKNIIQNGIEVEGVIFEFDDSTPPISIDSYDNAKYPIIRFVTKKGEWITEKSEYEVSSFLFKEGQKVKVIYNPENPKDFIFKTKVDFSKFAYLFLIAGIILFSTGLWFAYKYLTTKNQ